MLNDINIINFVIILNLFECYFINIYNSNNAIKEKLKEILFFIQIMKNLYSKDIYKNIFSIFHISNICELYKKKAQGREIPTSHLIKN